MDLKTFGRKMAGLCIGMQRVTELNYIITKVYSHGTLQCLKQKEKIVLAFVFFIFIFS